jgi:hypothetical protein
MLPIEIFRATPPLVFQCPKAILKFVDVQASRPEPKHLTSISHQLSAAEADPGMSAAYRPDMKLRSKLSFAEGESGSKATKSHYC